ncbi:MAG: alpha-amylase family glycosyl hydrolase [Bacteroidota bacterium]
MFDTNTKRFSAVGLFSLAMAISTLGSSCGLFQKKSTNDYPEVPAVMPMGDLPTKDITAVEPISEIDNPTHSIDWIKNNVVYEVNTRQFNSGGTFKSFMPEIPRIKALGVDVLWFMPVYPIGQLNRKGGLGSYYSIKNYHEINPEFGTMDDFKATVNAAHAQGMKVILDWVGNHTAWDHPWVTEHPDWYVHDSTGKIVTPWDWTDVAQLNFKNPELRKAMIAEMQFWVKECNIDGFRCDVAFLVPRSFWEEARIALEKEKPLFMLAEMENNKDIDPNPPGYMEKAFDAYYGWTLHSASADCAKGKITGREFVNKFTEARALFPAKAMMLSFLSNHDENTWNGTIEEKYADKWQVFSVLNYTLQNSLPLIYNGEEANNTKRLLFFEKDPITSWSDTSRYAWYRTMNRLKHTHPALQNGAWGAKEEVLKVTGGDENIYAFRRTSEGQTVTVIVNLSSKQQWIQAVGDRSLDGTEKTYVKSPVTIKHIGQGMPLDDWGYAVIVN